MTQITIAQYIWRISEFAERIGGEENRVAMFIESIGDWFEDRCLRARGWEVMD